MFCIRTGAFTIKAGIRPCSQRNNVAQEAKHAEYVVIRHRFELLSARLNHLAQK